MVSFLDRRGAGINREARGDTPSFRRLIDDVAEFIRASPTGGLTQVPVVLLAISWGGKLGVAIQRRRPGLVDGIALLCPGLVPRVRPTLLNRWGILLTRWLTPQKLFPVPLNDPELFTATARWQQYIREDPLALREITARLSVESVRLDYYLRFFRAQVQVPVLLLLAGQDRIIQNEPTRSFLSRFTLGKYEIIEYAGAHHTLEFEPIPDRFIDDLRRWLCQTVVNEAGRRETSSVASP
jgi:alpha-beta hydrolase superfamily lysophospholipase